MKKILIGLFTLIIAFSIMGIFSNRSNAQLGGVLVYPRYVELDFAEKERNFISKVIKVENPSNKAIRIRAYVESWDANEYGDPSFTAELLDRSLAKFVKFNPREFELQPGENQIVRLTAKLPEGEEGEYRGMIFFETVVPKEEILKPDKDKINVAIQFVTRFGVVVYAYKGNVSRNAQLHDFKFETIDNTQYLTADFNNDGNIHSVLEGTINLYDKTSPEQVAKDIAIKKVILPERSLKLLIPLDQTSITSGNYIAKMNLKYTDYSEKPQIIEAQTEFSYEKSASSSAKDKLAKPVDADNVEKTPDNVAQPIEIDESEIKLNSN